MILLVLVISLALIFDVHNGFHDLAGNAIEKRDQHIDAFEIAVLPLPKYTFYLDNGDQQVVKWAEEKKKELGSNEKIFILNFFNVANVK